MTCHNCGSEEARAAKLISAELQVRITLLVEKLQGLFCQFCIEFHKNTTARAQDTLPYIGNGTIKTKWVLVRHKESQMRLMLQNSGRHVRCL